MHQYYCSHQYCEARHRTNGVSTIRVMPRRTTAFPAVQAQHHSFHQVLSPRAQTCSPHIHAYMNDVTCPYPISLALAEILSGLVEEIHTYTVPNLISSSPARPHSLHHEYVGIRRAALALARGGCGNQLIRPDLFFFSLINTFCYM